MKSSEKGYVIYNLDAPDFLVGHCLKPSPHISRTCTFGSSDPYFVPKDAIHINKPDVIVFTKYLQYSHMYDQMFEYKGVFCFVNSGCCANITGFDFYQCRFN